ncbi:MAG: hypothetical protein WA549_06080 [Thermoplasmata archaeon]
MILPGLISLAFYKRRPGTVPIALGLSGTVLLSALLGYISPDGPLTRLGSIVIAMIGGVILYVTILAYLIYGDQPRHTNPPAPSAPPVPPSWRKSGVEHFSP